MTLTIHFIPILVALVGLIMFLAAKSNGDIKRIGEILLFVGLWVALWQLAPIGTTVIR
jgi:uncharacterized Tic20 family protein